MFTTKDNVVCAIALVSSPESDLMLTDDRLNVTDERFGFGVCLRGQYHGLHMRS